MTDPKPARLVVVQWLDTCHGTAGWVEIDELEGAGLEAGPCISVGWVVAESEDTLVLAPTLGFPHEVGFARLIEHRDAQGLSLLRIPQGCVRLVAEMEAPDGFRPGQPRTGETAGGGGRQHGEPVA